MLDRGGFAGQAVRTLGAVVPTQQASASCRATASSFLCRLRAGRSRNEDDPLGRGVFRRDRLILSYTFRVGSSVGQEANRRYTASEAFGERTSQRLLAARTRDVRFDGQLDQRPKARVWRVERPVPAGA